MKMFNRTIAFGILLAVMAAAPAFANTMAPKDTVDAIESWLLIVDQGDYSKSYDEGAQYFKNAVTSDKWQESLMAFRKPLGAVLSRKIIESEDVKTLPGAPDGDYVIARYKTSFENKSEGEETVTFMLDKDAQWRVAGYFIK